jgi:putative transposase
MIKTFKVQFKPNNKQRTRLFECAGVSRWSYNYALGRIKEHYENTGKFLSNGRIRKEITQLKKTEEYSWLKLYSNNIPKQAVKDACDAYKKFFKGQSKFPKFKSKKGTKPSFYQDNLKLKIDETHVKLEKLTTSRKKNKQKFNWIRLVEKNRIPTGKNVSYSNPRITFDGLKWWISVGVEVGDLTLDKANTKPIGIDLGVKDLAIVSTGEVYKNINRAKKVRMLSKRLKRLQKRASKQYEKLKKKGGENRSKSKNLYKLENLIRKTHKKLKNIRANYIHQITTSLVKAKPKYIVIEDLNISGMMKNKHLSKVIQEQNFYVFKRQLEYKCKWYGVELIIADRFYPSSKTCSNCGSIKKDLKLSDRVYKCSECGLEIDRDLNASINLRKYPKHLKSA